jgi:UDP-N-acetylglucosamine 2-epimerase
MDAHLEDHIRLIEPVSYFDMMVLEENARLIATDSGGVQREAYFLGIPCLTLREETEWVETVQVGWNRLVGTDPEQIVDAWFGFAPPSGRPPIFGDGRAGEHIAQILENEHVTFGLPHQGEEGIMDLVSIKMGVDV